MRSVNILGLQIDIPQSVNDVRQIAQQAPQRIVQSPQAIMASLAAAGRTVQPRTTAAYQSVVQPFVPRTSSGQPINLPVTTPVQQQAQRYQQGGGGAPGQITSQGAITMTQQTPGVDPFTYDWTGETQNAYNALKDFYGKLLDFTGGRLDLAKRMLEYTYQQGMRETTEEFETSKGEYERLFPQETAQMQTGLNKRGVLQSGFAAEDIRTLDEGQKARMQAVERAKADKESRLSAQRGFEVESEEKKFEEDKFNLERQRRAESEQMASRKYGIEGEKYNAQLAKAGQTENQRVQALTNAAITGSVSGTGTTSTPSSTRPGGYGSGDTEFRRFMQSTGKQGELDTATVGSTQQGAQYYALKRKYGF
jgi:hypothetical protein